jgi:hypothetical protein
VSEIESSEMQKNLKKDDLGKIFETKIRIEAREDYNV